MSDALTAAESDPGARLCAEAGLTFAGPSADVLELFGDKARSRELAASVGLPVLPATHQGRAEALVMVRAGATPERMIVLRLWAAPVRLEPVVVTATRDARTLTDVPASLDVLDATTLRRARPALGLAEALPRIGVRAGQPAIDDQRVAVDIA